MISRCYHRSNSTVGAKEDDCVRTTQRGRAISELFSHTDVKMRRWCFHMYHPFLSRKIANTWPALIRHVGRGVGVGWPRGERWLALPRSYNNEATNRAIWTRIGRPTTRSRDRRDSSGTSLSLSSLPSLR